MPQKKKNPDVAELTRGKSARVIGKPSCRCSRCEGLAHDLQPAICREDKERLFDSAHTVRACLRLMAAMFENTSVNADVCEARRASDLLATDLADISCGRECRSAKRTTSSAKSWRVGRKEQRALNQLSLASFNQ